MCPSRVRSCVVYPNGPIETMPAQPQPRCRPVRTPLCVCVSLYISSTRACGRARYSLAYSSSLVCRTVARLSAVPVSRARAAAISIASRSSSCCVSATPSTTWASSASRPSKRLASSRIARATCGATLELRCRQCSSVAQCGRREHEHVPNQLHQHRRQLDVEAHCRHAHPSARRKHHAVVVRHGEHQAAAVRVPVDGRHAHEWQRRQPPQQRLERRQHHVDALALARNLLLTGTKLLTRQFARPTVACAASVRRGRARSRRSGRVRRSRARACRTPRCVVQSSTHTAAARCECHSPTLLMCAAQRRTPR